MARVFLIVYIIGRFEMGKRQELGMSKSTIRAMIEEDESRGIYRLENKNEIKHFDRHKFKFEELRIFCHHGQLSSLGAFWSATEMRLNIGSEDYNVYISGNSSMVQKMHQDHQVVLTA